jgi:putative peptidoglycan lipid II flippase
MSPPKLPALRWAAAGVFVLALLARLIALLRETMIASRFGLGSELDGIYLGLAIPAALTAGAGGGLSRAAVAIAAGMASDRVAALARTGSRRLVAILLPISLLMALLAPLWINLLRVGEDSPPYGISAIGAVMGSLLLLGGCLAGLYNGLANAAARHQIGSLNPIAYNTIVCLSIYTLHDELGVYSIGVGLLAAEWLQGLVFLPVIGPLLASPTTLSGEGDWKKLGALFLPSAIIGTSLGINVAIDRAFATSLDGGSIAALSYAERLINVPVGLVATALATPLFTRLSHHFRHKRFTLERDTLHLGIRLIVLAGLPLGVLVAVFAPEVVGVLLERGKFDGSDVHITSIAIAGYAVGVPFQAMTTLLTAAGLLGRRAWATVWIMLGTCGLNAALDAALVGPLGVVGIALATSIVAFVRAVLLLWLLSPGWMGDRGLWRSGFSAVVSSLVLLCVLLPLATFLRDQLGESMSGRLVIGFSGGVATILIMLALYPVLLGREWRSLAVLRRRVAEGVAS